MVSHRIEVLTDSRNADADLSTKQFFAVTPSSTGAAVGNLLGENVTGILGLLQNKPGSGVEAAIGMLGVYPGKLAGTVALYDTVTCDASGEIIRSRPGDFIIGVALQAGVDNDECPILVCPQYPQTMWMTANDALTGKLGYGLSVHTTVGEADLGANGESAIGVALTEPGAGSAVKIQTYGACVGAIGTGGVTVGGLIALEDGGQFVAAATGDYICGVALATISAQATGAIFFSPRGKKA